MSKTFDLTPVFGPAVSVRHHSAAASRAVSRPANLRPAAKRSVRHQGLFRSLGRLLPSSAGIQTTASYGLVVLFFAAAISYVFLINSSAALGYKMKKIQNSIQEQSDIRHSLEIKTAEMSSLGAIDRAAESASLVGIKNEEFLAPTTITALKTSK